MGRERGESKRESQIVGKRKKSKTAREQERKKVEKGGRGRDD